MAVLSTKARAALPSSTFALPGGRFPMPDKLHAEKAVQLAPRSEHAGNISPAQVAEIRAKAKSRFGVGGGAPSLKDALIHKMMG